MPELGISKRLPKWIHHPGSFVQKQRAGRFGNRLWYLPKRFPCPSVRSLCDIGSHLALSPAWKQRECCEAEWVNLNRPRTRSPAALGWCLWSIIWRLLLSDSEMIPCSSRRGMYILPSCPQSCQGEKGQFSSGTDTFWQAPQKINNAQIIKT